MDTRTRSRKFLVLVAITLVSFVNSTPAPVGAQGAASLIVSEVHPSGSGNPAYAADWFEITNVGTAAADISGWKVDDSSNAIATAVALRGITTIPAGKSAIFFEGAATSVNDATIKANFSTAWFGAATPPAGVLIGAYGGAGVGLSTGGDAINLFDAAGVRVTGVSFGAATATRTFDNADGLAGVLSTLSTAGINGAFTAGTETGSPGRIAAPPSLTTIDLSTYVRVGRFPLPEPTTVAPPPGSLLAQEASAVAYNWDTDTLFITGDGGLSIVQVSKTGQLIDSMTLAAGDSPQGTAFYDPEGLTYVGNGRFVMSEERDRQAVLFTYAAGTTLTRAAAQTVTLGTFAPNIGLEGLSYDPLTGGFIFVKEIQPQGIFQTGIDFAAGTATNGSPTTENSVNLFDPSLLNVLDLADVFALSNLPTISGPGAERLLVLSQASAKVMNVDRAGNVSSVLNILPEPGTGLSAADTQHEGLTMDFNGTLYVVNENGGGNIDHPELWVYAPAAFPNQPPTGVSLQNQQTSIPENTVIAPRRKLADVFITDDGLGNNVLTVTGPDAASFEVDFTGLYLTAGVSLDFETKPSYTVTVAVDDASLGASPDASAAITLTVTDVVELPPTPPSVAITEVAPWGSSNLTPYVADWFELTNTGITPIDVTGWKMDDDSGALASARALTGVSIIAPGESVIFMETANLAAAGAAFRTAWFGASPPAGLQVGAYTGAGVGLSTGGDAVHVFDASGTVVANVTFGVASSAPFRSFDNAAGTNNGAIVQLSAVGVNGAFAAANDPNEIGSPGALAGPAVLIISEVAPWSSGNSPVGADWFEVTNVGVSAANITGWKVDDSSESPAGAALLSGVTSIAPGESVIFIETADLAAVREVFLATWFGGNPPAGLQIGSYTGSGLGLSTGGDAVNLYNPYNVLKAKVFFGASSTASPIESFDNAAGVNFAGISQFSALGTNHAFLAAGAAELGSPGTATLFTNSAPTFTPPADISTAATGPDGAVVTFAAGGDDADQGPIAAVCTPVSGATFPLGATTVDCTVTDDFGLSASGSFTVSVTNTAPAFTAPDDIVAEADGPAGTPVTFAATGTDAEEGTLTAVCSASSGETFPIGTTTVTCTVTDVALATASDAFTVTVRDTTAPVIAAHGNEAAVATGAAGAVVSFAAPMFTDAVSGGGTATCGPASGAVFPIGTSTVTCTAADAAGNVSTSAFTVTVADVTTPGEMRGDGFVRDDDAKYSFAFLARERATGAERARISIRIDEDGRNRGRRDRRRRDDRFESRSVDFMAFSDDPTVRPGRARRPQIDTVLFSGAGEWNGQGGYRYEVFAQDAGEPGRHRESIRVTITNAAGLVVASFSGDLDGGNIQSSRIRH